VAFLVGLIRVADGINEWIGRVVAWVTLGTVLVCAAVVVLRYVFAWGSICLQEAYVWQHVPVLAPGENPGNRAQIAERRGAEAPGRARAHAQRGQLLDRAGRLEIVDQTRVLDEPPVRHVGQARQRLERRHVGRNLGVVPGKRGLEPIEDVEHPFEQHLAEEVDAPGDLLVDGRLAQAQLAGQPEQVDLVAQRANQALAFPRRPARLLEVTRLR